MTYRINIMPGKKFGMWTVVQEAEPNKWGQTMVLCLCKCGKECNVSSSILRRGKSKKCSECRAKWRDYRGKYLYNPRKTHSPRTTSFQR